MKRVEQGTREVARYNSDIDLMDRSTESYATFIDMTTKEIAEWCAKEIAGPAPEIKLGATYRTRGGAKAYVVATNLAENVRPVVAIITYEAGTQMPLCYFPNGTVWNDGADSSDDLVELIEDRHANG